MKLTKEEIIELWEENLNMKLYYHYDEIKDEKRPFGNSGYSAIGEDIFDLLNKKMKFEVSSEDEFSDKVYDEVQEIFKQMIDFGQKFSKEYEVKIIKKQGDEE